MKRTVLLFITMVLSSVMAWAQNSKNNQPDAIVGVYRVEHGDQLSKVRVYKDRDGSYTAQCIWLRDSIDPQTGKLVTDTKNPDKSLRNTPCNKIIIVQGLKYNKKKCRWDDGKIYDPTRGIKANCQAEFTDDGRLKIRGSLLGIGETVYWTRLK